MKSAADEARGGPGRPVTVGIVDESELVVTGLEAMLSRHPEQVAPSDPEDADLVLCDPVGRSLDIESYLADVARRSRGRIVVYTWRFDPVSVRRAVAAGAQGFASKAVPSDALVDVLLLVHRGERVEAPVTASAGSDVLSAREAEVLALICRGRSNLEIAADLYVSVNSVKTYIRQIYQKIGVARRSQAVAWGIEHGY